MIGTRSLGKKIFMRSSPVWSILLMVGASLLQVVGSRYLKEKKLHVTRSDVKTAMMGGVLGYFGFVGKRKF